MQRCLRNFYLIYLVFNLLTTPFICHALTETNDYLYQYALVRDLSSSFENSLKLNPPPEPIDLTLAVEQHENYISVLETLVSSVVRLEGDIDHPDCNFIEDTAIVIDDIAVISRMGAPEREGEEILVAKTLENLNRLKVIHLTSPATMDGGDVLFTGKHLFVGLSKRTNSEAVKQLKEIFQGKLDVIGIPVIEGLHFKSVISLFDTQTLIVAMTRAGKEIKRHIEQATANAYEFVSVPDPTASNVLRVGSTLIIQKGFPESEVLLQALCERKQVSIVKINMSELIKADGALTCGSLLIK